METFFYITTIIIALLLLPLSFGLLLSHLSSDETNNDSVNALANGIVPGGHRPAPIGRYAFYASISPFVVLACMVGVFQNRLKDKSLVSFAHFIGFLGYFLCVSSGYLFFVSDL